MTRFRTNPNCVYRALADGSSLVVNVQNGEYVTLNCTAHHFLQLLSEGRETPQIVREFAREYRIDESVAARDIAEVTEQLATLNILEEA